MPDRPTPNSQRPGPRAPLRATVQGVFAAALCLCITAASHAEQFYVAPQGSNTMAGTPDAPWRTIAFALAQAQPGDTVYLNAGRYAERVRFPRSGSRRNGFITLRNVPGETPIIDGSTLKVEGGEQGLVTVADRSYVRVQGLHLTGFRSDDESVPMGVFVTGAGAHIELLDNRITHIETHHPGCEGNALGIAIYGRRAPEPLSEIRIRGNEVAHLKTGCSESVSVNGNVSGFEIAHNHIHDNNNIGIDVIGHEGMAPDPRFDIARNGVIASNTVHDITSSDNSAYPDGEMAAGGIYVDGGRDVVIERNRVFGNDIGIELASEHGGQATRNVLVRNNLIYNNRSMGLAIGGYASDVGGAEGCRVVHNTFYHNDTARSWGGEVVIQHNARDNVFRNNIVYANAQAVFINYYVESTAQPLTSDHNLFYVESGPSAGQWQWRGEHFQGMASYVKATGNDRHSLFGNPRFVAAHREGDFRLNDRSAAIDVGLNIDAAAFSARDFDGRPRRSSGAVDVGAFQSNGS